MKPNIKYLSNSEIPSEPGIYLLSDDGLLESLSPKIEALALELTTHEKFTVETGATSEEPEILSFKTTESERTTYRANPNNFSAVHP
ncbi:hypothetical protein [Lysinibacillus sphaericus]|uniref:hypothetical protein n=1 Tax=Lysinibacillus sphaericus TaxID=1421 RepID=UPI003D7F56BA